MLPNGLHTGLNRFKDQICPADLSLNALLGDEGLQSARL